MQWSVKWDTLCVKHGSSMLPPTGPAAHLPRWPQLGVSAKMVLCKTAPCSVVNRPYLVGTAFSGNLSSGIANRPWNTTSRNVVAHNSSDGEWQWEGHHDEHHDSKSKNKTLKWLLKLRAPANNGSFKRKKTRANEIFPLRLVDYIKLDAWIRLHDDVMTIIVWFYAQRVLQNAIIRVHLTMIRPSKILLLSLIETNSETKWSHQKYKQLQKWFPPWIRFDRNRTLGPFFCLNSFQGSHAMQSKVEERNLSNPVRSVCHQWVCVVALGVLLASSERTNAQ